MRLREPFLVRSVNRHRLRGFVHLHSCVGQKEYAVFRIQYDWFGGPILETVRGRSDLVKNSQAQVAEFEGAGIAGNRGFFFAGVLAPENDRCSGDDAIH